MAAWYGGFVGYQAYFNSGGRRTPASAAAPARVRRGRRSAGREDGGPARRVVFRQQPPAGVRLPARRLAPEGFAWHDELARSVVLETGAKPAWARALISSAAAVFAFVAAAGTLLPIGSAAHRRYELRVDARACVRALSKLEARTRRAPAATRRTWARWRRRSGLAALPQLVARPRRAVLRLEANGEHFRITARRRRTRRTASSFRTRT